MEVNYLTDQKNSETIINLKGLSIHIPTRQQKPITILNQTDLIIQKNKKFGLIGRNGQGKSTLLKAILSSQIPSTIQPFGLEQSSPEGEHTIFQETIATNKDYLDWLERKRVLKQKQEELSRKEIPTNLVDSDLDSVDSEMQLAEEEDRLREEGLVNGYFGFEKLAKKILIGMGFPESSHEKPVNSFSGGWRMRLNLSKLLVGSSKKDEQKNNRLILLDEPTNHLDLHAISWLSRYLQNLENVTLILVTHNMDFLNNIVDSLLEIESGQLSLYRGNYEKYVQQKSHEFQIKLKQFQKDRKKMKKTDARRLKPRETRTRVEITTEASGQHIDYQICLDNVKFCYDASTVHFLSYPEFSCKTGERVVIIGDNGSGKSTFLKLVMGKLKPTSGHVDCDPRIKFGYLSQNYQDILDYSLTPVSLLEKYFPNNSEQDYRKHLSLVSLIPDRHHSLIGTLSGGEQTRVIFAYLAFLQPNFIIFDEPTNNLDLYTIKTLSELINSLECGVILVTHDTYLVRELADYQLFICEKGDADTCNTHSFYEYDGNIDDYLDECLANETE